jgi:thioredoxin reductase
MHAPDPTSIAGKVFATRDRYDHVVLGGGDAGIAAARAAAAAGERTLLVDEHPLDPGLFGMDVPYLFGGRLDASTRNAARMEERIVAARPALLEAMEEGIEVAMATAAWGCFPRSATSRSQPHALLGLADAGAAWLVAFARLTIATGARDATIPFDGWTLPGVMGARGFDAALRLYAAFTGRRVAVVGGGALADGVASAARAAGIALAAHVASPVALRILGRDEVEGIAWEDGDGRHEVACDTVVLAVDAVPMVELPDQAGCAVAWDAARGGFVPVLGQDGAASVAGLRVVGDAAGTGPAMRADWIARAAAADGALVCACEEVRAGDLRALRPPRYLGAEGPRDGLGAIPCLDQDHVKRLTRAGMGACQGRRCRESVHAILSRDGAKVGLASHRPPLRPLPLSVMAALEEDPEVAANWTGWFGIAGQWLPHWEPVPEGAEFIGARLGAGSSDK